MGVSLPIWSDGCQRRPASWAIALGVAIVLGAPGVAAARIGVAGDDVERAAAAMLSPADPCRALGVAVVWVPGLRGESEEPAAGAAIPGVCAVGLNPGWWADQEPCWRRRLVFHEVGHVGGRDDEPDSGGIMDPDPWGRADVPVPGCPGPSLTDRVTDRVLELVPVGYEVSCGRSGPVVYCAAERGGRVRRYRGRAGRGGIRVVRL